MNLRRARRFNVECKIVTPHAVVWGPPLRQDVSRGDSSPSETFLTIDQTGCCEAVLGVGVNFLPAAAFAAGCFYLQKFNLAIEHQKQLLLCG